MSDYCAIICGCVCVFDSDGGIRDRTWDLKYVSCGVDSTSADAISRWRRIWRKEGLFLGLQFLQNQDGKDNCVHSQCTVKSIKSSSLRLTVFIIVLSSSQLSRRWLTNTVWGGSWSHQGSFQVWAAEDCCFPHPRWWQMSPRLYKGSLQLASPTVPLRTTFKLSQALFIQEV